MSGHFTHDIGIKDLFLRHLTFRLPNTYYYDDYYCIRSVFRGRRRRVPVNTVRAKEKRDPEFGPSTGESGYVRNTSRTSSRVRRLQTRSLFGTTAVFYSRTVFSRSHYRRESETSPVGSRSSSRSWEPSLSPHSLLTRRKVVGCGWCTKPQSVRSTKGLDWGVGNGSREGCGGSQG